VSKPKLRQLLPFEKSFRRYFVDEMMQYLKKPTASGHQQSEINREILTTSENHYNGNWDSVGALYVRLAGLYRLYLTMENFSIWHSKDTHTQRRLHYPQF
jgi:hypothetical protein